MGDFIATDTKTVQVVLPTPAPTPTPRLPDLPIRPLSNDCTVVSGSGDAHGFEGELNGIRYNVQSVVGVGTTLNALLGSLLPSRDPGLYCAYIVASHSPPTKESSLSVQITIELGRKSIDSEPKYIMRETFFANCNQDESICVWESPLFGIPMVGYHYTIRAATDHTFTTTEGATIAIQTVACFDSYYTDKFCKSGDTND